MWHRYSLCLVVSKAALLGAAASRSARNVGLGRWRGGESWRKTMKLETWPWSKGIIILPITSLLSFSMDRREWRTVHYHDKIQEQYIHCFLSTLFLLRFTDFHSWVYEFKIFCRATLQNVWNYLMILLQMCYRYCYRCGIAALTSLILQRDSHIDFVTTAKERKSKLENELVSNINYVSNVSNLWFWKGSQRRVDSL
jgi:hypothetical protein